MNDVKESDERGVRQRPIQKEFKENRKLESKKSFSASSLTALDDWFTSISNVWTATEKQGSLVILRKHIIIFLNKHQQELAKAFSFNKSGL